MRNRVVAVLAGAAVLAAGTWLLMQVGSGGDAQPPGPDTVALGQPEAAWGEPFSFVSTVREFPDGTVLVADPLGQAVVHLDLDAGTVDTIGGVGEGPDEYRQPDAVWPLPGGRTLLVDLGNGRLTELGPDLEFGATRPYSMGDIARGEIVMALPQAVDDRGRLYFRSLEPGAPQSDSGSVLRFAPDTEALDEVASIKLPETVTETQGGPNEQNQRVSAIPLSPADAWGVAPDGRLVVARAGEYRIDWIAEDGSVASGPPTPHTPVAIGRAEQEEWAQAQLESGGGFSISVEIENGAMTTRASRGGFSDDDDQDLDAYAWPDAKPPFYNAPVRVDERGRAWVRRHREGGEPPLYDVFDGSGERSLIVEFPMGRRVVSFGSGVLYAARTDEYGLHTLERYALP